jgi:hypothetical protein
MTKWWVVIITHLLTLTMKYRTSEKNELLNFTAIKQCFGIGGTLIFIFLFLTYMYFTLK